MDITGLGHLTGCTAAWHFCVLAPSRQIVLKIVCLFESVLDNNKLEKEIIKAEMQGKSVIIELDSNSKLGPEVIPQDPHSQSPNGKLLADIISRHTLILANGLTDKATGSIQEGELQKTL